MRDKGGTRLEVEMGSYTVGRPGGEGRGGEPSDQGNFCVVSMYPRQVP